MQQYKTVQIRHTDPVQYMETSTETLQNKYHEKTKVNDGKVNGGEDSLTPLTHVWRIIRRKSHVE